MKFPNNEDLEQEVCPTLMQIKETEWKGMNDPCLLIHQANCQHPCCKKGADFMKAIFKR